AHRGGAGRSLSRAADRRTLPLPRILHRRRAGPRRALRFLFLQRDSRARPRRHRRCRGLSLSRRIDPPLPATRCLGRDDAGGRLCPRVVSALERRHRRAALGLAVVTVYTDRAAPPCSTAPPISSLST